MKKDDFDKKLHRRIAQLAVGASAIRNQGGSGLIETCRNYFESKIDINDFFTVLIKKDKYLEFLDFHTDEIVKLFPDGAKSWGAARKGLNLFFRDICYNTYFAHKFQLPIDFKENNEKLKYMEVPLDKDVATRLVKEFPEELPKWNSIKNLTKVDSEKYQKKAEDLAQKKEIAKVHLDLIFWRDKN